MNSRLNNTHNSNNGFFNFIKINFGIHNYNTLKSYARVNDQISDILLKLVFLIKCRRNNIFPKFIIHKSNHIDNNSINIPAFIKAKITSFKYKVKSFLLSNEIKLVNWQLDRCNKQRIDILYQMYHRLPFEMVQHFRFNEYKKYDHQIKLNQNRLTIKFDFLLKDHINNLNIKYNDKALVNLTNKEIPENVKLVLSFGPKFAPPIIKKDIPVLELVSDIEYAMALEKPDDNNLDNEIKTNLAFTIDSFIKSADKLNPVQKYINKCYKETKEFLKDNSEIYITSSDKGKNTVVLEKHSYDQKMLDLLGDNNTYEMIDEDPTRNLELKNNKYVNELFKNGIIDRKSKLQLTSDTAHTARIYGQPKTHKPGAPCRPIVDTKNSPGYNLSKYLANILQNVSDTEKYNVKNSSQFKQFVDTITMPQKYKLISFDVVSLFTNIPVDLALWALSKKWNSIEQFTKIRKFEFFKLIRFCCQECAVIKYNGRIYKQIKGLQMGSSLAPILADLVLEMLLDFCIPLFPERPIFIKKYVDDLICGIHEDHITRVHNILNEYNQNVQFTIEEEVNNKINYLDMTLIRVDNKIITNWYRKEISSDRLLNYLSGHPKYLLDNVGYTFIKKVLELSDESFHNENLKIAKQILRINNYPENTIKNFVSKLYNQNYQDNRINENDESSENDGTKENDNNENDEIINNNHTSIFSSMKYIPVLSENIKKKMEQRKTNVKLAFKPANTSRQQIFTKLKDKIKHEEKSEIVYKIECGTCDSVYIGQSSKKLNTRIKQHKNDLTNINKQESRTALIQHTKDTGHIFKYDDAKIIGQERNKRKREMLEATHILLHNSVNKKIDTNNISKQFLLPIKTFGDRSNLSPIRKRQQNIADDTD